MVIVYPGVLQSVFAAVVSRYFVLKGLQSFRAHLYSYLSHHTEMLQKPENKILYTHTHTHECFSFYLFLTRPHRPRDFTGRKILMKLNIWIFLAVNKQI